jgi:alpha-tubulin suppressor-like RCC1 family protein
VTARPHRFCAVLAASTLGLLLGACGSGLYDASGVPLIEGLTCNEATQVVCGGVCTEEDAAHCGASCADCTTDAGSIPAGAAAACVRTGGVSSCGFECADGLMRCSTGCCEATAVAAGERFTCALASDGAVSCWGANEGGQLGDGTTSTRAAPARVALPGAAAAIGAGVSHACAVTPGGAVRCWGSNVSGQVTGSPGAAPLLSPAATPVTAGATAVVAGASHTCALLSTGAVRCWGLAEHAGNQAGVVAAGATALAAGRDHTCAIVGGAVQCWGANASGQLGNGGTVASATPVVALPSGIQLLTAGASQTCAATAISTGGDVDTVLRCWGDTLGASFSLGEPQLVPAVPMKSATQSTVNNEVGLLAVGRKHVCVRDRAEAIECFGANDRGQLGGTPTGPGETVTVPLPAAPPAAIATSLSAGADHTCAVVNGGRLRCWGANESGQLGNGSTADPGIATIVTPLGR